MTRGPDPKHSDTDILAVFRESPDPVLFAQEIADALDTTRQTVYSRCADLVEKGHLRTKKPGERSRIYWLTYEGERALADDSADASQ
jgi:predicted transcriptional regulator